MLQRALPAQYTNERSSTGEEVLIELGGRLFGHIQVLEARIAELEGQPKPPTDAGKDDTHSVPETYVRYELRLIAANTRREQPCRSMLRSASAFTSPQSIAGSNLKIARYVDTTQEVEGISVEEALTPLRQAERRRDEAVAKMDERLAEMGSAR